MEWLPTEGQEGVLPEGAWSLWLIPEKITGGVVELWLPTTEFRVAVEGFWIVENQRLCCIQCIGHTANMAVFHHECLESGIVLILLVYGCLFFIQTIPKLFAAIDCCISGNPEVFEGLQGGFYLLFGFCQLYVCMFNHGKGDSVF